MLFAITYYIDVKYCRFFEKGVCIWYLPIQGKFAYIFFQYHIMSITSN